MPKTAVKEKNISKEVQKNLGLSHILAVPRIQKIVVNSGIGRALTGASKQADFVEEVSKELSLITGQKPVVTKAKKAIASFKTRVGMPSGLKVTLRGVRAADFLKKTIEVALPRSRDFKGISSSAVDGNGNLTIGIREHTIYPEVADSARPIGFEISVVTSAKNRDHAMELFRALGIPFKKSEE